MRNLRKLLLAFVALLAFPACSLAAVAKPTASFTYSPSAPVTGQSVTFDGSASTCAATPCSYRYSDTANNATLGTSKVSSFTFQAVGTKFVKLVVTDSRGRTASVQHNVVVAKATQPPPPPAVPQNTTAPSIAGTPTVGQTLTASAGSWTNIPTEFQYVWSDGTNNQQDTLPASDAGKMVSVTVTACNSAGCGTDATSAAVGPVNGGPPPTTSPPVNTATPTISGTPQVGNTLTAAPGTWTSDGSSVSFTYLWSDGTTGKTDALSAADANQNVSVTVTASNDDPSSTQATSASVLVAPASPPPPPGCDLNATTSNFAAQVSAATAGQTVCLATGNYGTWTGTNKAITVKAASGASPTMQVNFGTSASSFTLSGIVGAGGALSGSKNVTIENSTFTSTLALDGPTATGDVINGNNWLANTIDSGPNGKIIVNEGNGSTGTVANPSFLIENNDIENGDMDGVHIGGGAGIVVLDNTFKNLCENLSNPNANHTDNLQFEGGSQVDIKGNYMYAPQNCPTQGLTSYDGETNGVIIEDNVVDVPRDWGIELYSDMNSIVRHNTVVWHPKSYSEFNTGTGQIDIDRKSEDPAGSGTHVYDNVADVGFANGSTGTADHNTDPSTVSYVNGPLGASSSYADAHLAAGSPGKGAASDGTDTGIS